MTSDNNVIAESDSEYILALLSWIEQTFLVAEICGHLWLTDCQKEVNIKAELCLSRIEDGVF